MIKRETPTFTGITVHRDPRGRFAIRYPTNWLCYDIGAAPPAGDGTAVGAVGAQEGIGFAPAGGGAATAFTAWATPLEVGVVAEDLEVLRAGVDAGLAALQECQVEAASDIVLGNLLRFERIYTYRDTPSAGQPDQPGQADALPGAVRKRKQWLLYVDTWLICLTWQGASLEEYEHWFAMANQSFLTFQIPEALWFFTDRELLAQSGDPARRTPSRPESG